MWTIRAAFRFSSLAPAVRWLSSDRRSLEFHKKVLGVAAPLNVGEIKQNFRRKAKESHPDLGGDARAFRLLYEAYEALLQHATTGSDAGSGAWSDDEGLNKAGGVPVERMPTVREYMALKDTAAAAELWSFLYDSGISPLSVADVEGAIALACSGAGGPDAALDLLTSLQAAGRLPHSHDEVSSLYNVLLWHYGQTQDFDRILGFLSKMDAAGVTFDQSVIQGIFTYVPRSM